MNEGNGMAGRPIPNVPGETGSLAPQRPTPSLYPLT